MKTSLKLGIIGALFYFSYIVIFAWVDNDYPIDLFSVVYSVFYFFLISTSSKSYLLFLTAPVLCAVPLFFTRLKYFAIGMLFIFFIMSGLAFFVWRSLSLAYQT